MKDDRRDSLHLPLRQVLIDRVRIILLVCLVGAAMFVAIDLWKWPATSAPALAIKLVGLALTAAALLITRAAWAVRHAHPLAVLIVAAAYVLTALSGVVSASGESRTTAVLFAGAALTTAAILPWGVVAQAITAAVAAAALTAILIVAEGGVQMLGVGATAAVAFGLALSVLAAREVGRARSAHRRELLERRRAEAALRRLALRLEQRVAQRTAALEEAHATLRRHQAELAHVLRLHTMGEMAAALAHEINQPLCAITNYAQGGLQRLRGAPADDGELRHALERITDEGLRASAILRRIRAVVQRETAVSRGVDVNLLAADALRVLAPQARAHGVTVRLEGGTGLPAVRADGTQIEQVVMNLVLNGVEAAALAQGLRREVVVATTVHGDGIEVAVSDTGAGLAAPVRDRLFTPFLTTKPRGLGLGLAISRSIVESHGGRLWASARPGAGMTFRFSLPSDGP